MGTLLTVIRWVFQKCATASLIAVLGLAACGLWLYLKDNVDFDAWRQEALRTVNGERTKVREALGDVAGRMSRISAELLAEEERERQALRVMAQLKELESTWDRLVGNPAQQKANAEQIERMTALRKQIAAKKSALQEEFTRATWERDGLELAQGKIEARLQDVAAQQSRVLHYLERTWNHPLGREPLQMAAKWWLLVALGFYFLGPSAWKMALYFLVAPVVIKSRPVRLQASASVLPEVGDSGVSADVSLRPGERLWVKEKFLQASDEGLRRQTRYLLDWRIPMTCLATGLVELIEMSNPGTGADGEKRLTLSHQADPHSELAVITLVEGASLILRPSFLAGVVVAEKQRLRLRRRWQLFRWQAWVTMQFRYFEFAGPCRLIVAGRRGVRTERLAAREGAAVPARRANQEATMGFTPNLDYRAARAETFWSYFRGMNPLFDDLFAGRGLFLCQQVSGPEGGQAGGNFWSGVWGGLLKVFGM